MGQSDGQVFESHYEALAQKVIGKAYETPLSDEEEVKFQGWKAQHAPDDSGEDYDLRGAFSAGITPGKDGHWPDTFKKPNHPTFSIESIYRDAAPDKAGRWDGERFIPAGAGIVDQLLGTNGAGRYQTWPEKAVREVAKAFTLPGRGYAGELKDSDIPEEAFNFATTFMGAGLATAGVRTTGVGIFGGKMGTMNDAFRFNTVRIAEDALKGGYSPQEVYKRTGVFLGPDFKARYEISDAGAKFKPGVLKELDKSVESRIQYDKMSKTERDWMFPEGAPVKRFYNPYSYNKETTLGDILDHPELFKHYPDLAKVKLDASEIGTTFKGRYRPDTDSILLEGNTEGEMLSTLLHEIQHAVQKREGFVRGGNPAEWMTNKETVDALKSKTIEMDSKLRTAYDDVYKEMGRENIPKGWKHYTNIRFLFNKEAEGARLVKYEQDMLKVLEENAPRYVRGMRTLMEANKRIRADEDEAYANYRAMFGETEARIVQERMYLTKGELKNHPYEGEEFKSTYAEGFIKDKHLVEQGQNVDPSKGVTVLPE